jgi:hypothetical protein
MVESRRELAQSEQPDEKGVPAAGALAVVEPPSTEPEIDIHPADEPGSLQESCTPMLDVHAPHEPLHTWRGFFIHIATIVIGLLIAIGLEQTVEFFHHRNQVAETREALRTERLINVNRFAEMTAEFRRRVPILEQNLAVYRFLVAHPGAPPDQWPATIDWSNLAAFYFDAAWRVAQQGSILEHMPLEEVRRDTELYRRLQLLNEATLAMRGAFNDAQSVAIEEPNPERLTPAQLEQQVARTSVVVQRCVVVAQQQWNLTQFFPEFRPSPTIEELRLIYHRNRESPGFGAVRDAAGRIQRYENSLSRSGERAAPDVPAVDANSRHVPDRPAPALSQ